MANFLRKFPSTENFLLRVYIILYAFCVRRCFFISPLVQSGPKIKESFKVSFIDVKITLEFPSETSWGLENFKFDII